MRILIGLVLLAAAVQGGSDSILDAALEVARRDHPAVPEAEVRALIQAGAQRYRSLLKAGLDPASAMQLLIFKEMKLQSVAELDSADNLHLDSVLKGRKGYCLSLSVIALAVAERADAPFFGVALPNHFLIRYDNGVNPRRNLEMTRNGAAISDEQLQKRYGSFEKGSVYLRNLRPAEVKAYLLHNRGYVALLKKRYKAARADFEAAIRIQPGIGEAHRNLGVLFGEQKKWVEAKKEFIAAINIHAADLDAMINLAIARHALGERVEALQDLAVVLAMDPERTRAEELRDRWLAEQQGKPKIDSAEALPQAPEGLKPGLHARYYAGMKFNLLRAERIDKELDFDWRNAAPHPKLPRDRFSARWDGYFKAPRSGVYTFFVAANDGVRLFLGGRTLIENWKNMGTTNHYATREVRLEAGWHAIRVEHFDGMGGARLMVRVGVEGVEHPLDPATHLFHKPPTAAKR